MGAVQRASAALSVGERRLYRRCCGSCGVRAEDPGARASLPKGLAPGWPDGLVGVTGGPGRVRRPGPLDQGVAASGRDDTVRSVQAVRSVQDRLARCRLTSPHGRPICRWTGFHPAPGPAPGTPAVRYLFEGAPATGVVDAVRAFRNDDGGFGHGLEPDMRCPASLPVDVEVALQALVTAKASDRGAGPGRVRLPGQGGGRAAECEGAVPPAFPVIEGFPRAAHWSDWTYKPGLNPTAGLVGLLYRLGVEHPWVEEATAYCWASWSGLSCPAKPTRLSEVMVFLEKSPTNERSGRPRPGWSTAWPGRHRGGPTRTTKARLVSPQHRPAGRQPVAQPVRRKRGGGSPRPPAA